MKGMPLSLVYGDTFGSAVHLQVFLKASAGNQEEHMGDQDRPGKLFMACRDVFAELVNVLVYQGEKVLAEDWITFPTGRAWFGAARN